MWSLGLTSEKGIQVRMPLLFMTIFRTFNNIALNFKNMYAIKGIHIFWFKSLCNYGILNYTRTCNVLLVTNKNQLPNTNEEPMPSSIIIVIQMIRKKLVNFSIG